MLDDIFQATRQSLLERLASPLLGSFVLAWCMWNWKFLVILFSSATVTQTFALIQRIVFPGTLEIILYGVLLPLISALLYVFVYPYPARYVYEFTLKRQHELNETKKRIADETPLTVEESRRLRADYVEYERKQKKIIADLHEEVTRLNAALEARTPKQELEGFLAGEDFSHPGPTPTQIEVLRLIEKSGGEAFEPEIIRKSASTKTQIEYDIGELVQQNLVTRSYRSSHKAYLIKFTHEGRKALLNINNN